MSAICENGLVILKHTEPENLEYVMKSERDPENSLFVGQWTYEDHQAALTDSDILHLVVFNKPENQLIGFAILAGLKNSNQSIELKRLVITDKGKGYGKETLHLIKSLAFEKLEAHRLWLDVRSNNPRAKHVYEFEGLVVEGTLRESVYLGEQYLSLVVMSMLESEFEGKQRKDEPISR